MPEDPKDKRDEREDRTKHPMREKIRDMIQGFVPRDPRVVEWEIQVVPRVYIVHPITGEKYAVAPREPADERERAGFLDQPREQRTQGKPDERRDDRGQERKDERVGERTEKK